MIVERATDVVMPDVFARVEGIVDRSVRLLLKLEGFNAAGSIKLKTAVGIIADLEERGVLSEGATLIETTSGNMGIALSVVARARRMGFVCVTDEKMTAHNKNLIRAYGSELVVLPNSTFAERRAYIEERLRRDPALIWTRQFHNAANPATHERTTALEILSALPRVDYVFIGTGTGGTLTGCARVFRERQPATRIVAVDVLGSKHFTTNEPPTRRGIPGIGATERSPFLDAIRLDDVVIVDDQETRAACRLVLDRSGWMLGGSSGSVVAAILRQASRFRPGDIVLGISADFGERYLEAVYANGAESSEQCDPGSAAYVPGKTLFTTERTLLRLLCKTDAEPIFRYRADPEIARYQSWEPVSLDQVRTFVGEQLRGQPLVAGSWSQVAIVLRSTDEVIGDIGIHVSDTDPTQVELGITLDASHQGRGLATEVLRGLLAFAFAELGKRRVTCSIDPRNVRSIRLVERVHMRREAHFVESIWFKGEWVDDVVYAMLSQDFERLFGEAAHSAAYRHVSDDLL